MVVVARKSVAGRSHAERRREAESGILQAALRIISKRGMDQLTLAEAGEAAGYSRALPAHYFGSREALLTAVADHVAEAYRTRLRAGDRTEAPRGIEGLLAGIAFYVDDGRKSAARLRGFYEVLNAGLRRPAIAPAIARLNRDSVEGFARSIRATRGQAVILGYRLIALLNGG